MHRSLFQIYVRGSDKALEFYKRAFNAETVCAYTNDDGTYMHAELNVHGQILAISELGADEAVPGNTMQLCLHFGAGNAGEVYKAYDVLKEDSLTDDTVGDTGYSKHGFSLIDRYGVHWCVFE